MFTKKGGMMGARTDDTQNFLQAWMVPGEQELQTTNNDTPYPDASLEAKYWGIYRKFFYMMNSHAELKDVSGLKWHMKMMELTRDKIQEMIAEIEANEKT